MIDPKHNGNWNIRGDPGRQSDKSKTANKDICKVTNDFFQYQKNAVNWKLPFLNPTKAG